MAGEGENPKIQRRLAAIVVADIAGYSALLGGDEEATIRDLNAHQVVIWPMIGEYGGRIITTAGDGFLAEFSSVLTAVKCALAIQQVMAERNAPVDPAKRMQFRIGINQGDVVFDDTFVHGIGVNIASRLEDIAEPGGICISGKVQEEVTGKIDAEFEDCGQQSLKNIALPVRVYRISPAHRNKPAAATGSPPTLSDKPRITERHQRRLAAILAADIARYSAIMGADEVATVRDLKAHQAVVLPMIGGHGGRIIDTAGDGILAEFRSVVNAVECAVAVQKTMAERNADILPDRQMKFRIGVNLGDVIHDDTRVYGDGVNIAARLESIADPGGICVSGAVYEQVQKKLPLAFTDLGAQPVKNISEPVRVYRVNRECLGATQVVSRSPHALPDKPSIAVLPFTNLSGDKEQDYFSDGITEDIITELSRFSELFVIARNSSFQYKGRFVDVRQVGHELGVQHVLQGSIRRAGERVRITGQLIDATGTHRWADHYDRRLEDIFAVQDEVARTIVNILAAHVNKAEAARALLKPPSSWQAHDYFLRGVDTYNSFLSTFLPEAFYEARRLFEGSLSVDPGYARAYAALSNTYTTAFGQPVCDGYLDPTTIEQAYELAAKAVQLDPNLPLAHAKLGIALAYRSPPQEAISAFERAIALNPSFTDWRFAIPLVFSGQFARAIEVAEAHMRVDPFYPPLVQVISGFARYMLNQCSDALPLLRAAVLRAPNARLGRVALAATYVRLGRLEEARAAAAEVLRIEPTYTLERTERRLRRFSSTEHAEKYLEDLRQAGLPES